MAEVGYMANGIAAAGGLALYEGGQSEELANAGPLWAAQKRSADSQAELQRLGKPAEKA